jgi:hypothetical protein
MINERAITIRVTEAEAELLAAYAEQNGQSQSEVLRSHIRSLESRLRRVTPENVEPFLLPSLPLSRRDMFPPVAAVYFFLTEAGKILYVGQCANLGIRFGNHPKFEAALASDPHARMHWLERRTNREGFEAKCIARFAPPLNGRK